MGKIKLDSRLSMVSKLVRNDKVVADIGTDHAYLLSYLVENGICKSGIAADVRQGPLDNAKNTVQLCGLDDKIKLILSNGLENIKPNSCDDIVIAGMGGILISEILSNVKWIKNNDINIIAQAMTHVEDVRKYFVENGFEIVKESACVDAKRLYCAMSARYTGKIKSVSPSYFYIGELSKNTDDISKQFVNHQFQRLMKKLNALKSAKDIDEKEVIELESLICDFKENAGEMLS